QEERERVGPGGPLTLEGLKGFAQATRAARLKIAPGLMEKRALERNDGAVIDALRGKGGLRHGRGIQQPILDQKLRTDQLRIAGESREALIGGMTVARWTEREDLPPLLPGVDQPLDPVACGGAQIADAVRARQRRRVQKHSRRPWSFPLRTVAHEGVIPSVGGARYSCLAMHVVGGCRTEFIP